MMNPLSFKELVGSFRKFSILAQKSIGQKDTLEKKQAFHLESYLQIFQSIDVFCYMLMDSSQLKIVEVGGAFEQLLGYEPKDFKGRGYQSLLKLHRISDVIKAARGGNLYLEYLYKQPITNRPFVKANRTNDMKRKDGKWIHVLSQSIPVLFNDKGEVIYFLVVLTHIETLKTDRNYTHYILDASNPTFIKKIALHPNLQSASDLGLISNSEKKVLTLMADGLSSKQIADRLNLSEHTIKNHRKNMLRKTETTSSSALVKKAILEGWI
jgi:DNA-binding CsgD family transcriptional regulator